MSVPYDMSVSDKPRYSYQLTRSAFCLALVFITTMGWVHYAQGAVCFADPKQAYNYLLAQENSELQARTQMAVNINRASEAELTTLRGIGSSKAQAIVLYREMFGEFQSIDELAYVKGIGIKTIDNNRTRLQLYD